MVNSNQNIQHSPLNIWVSGLNLKTRSLKPINCSQRCLASNYNPVISRHKWRQLCTILPHLTSYLLGLCRSSIHPLASKWVWLTLQISLTFWMKLESQINHWYNSTSDLIFSQQFRRMWAFWISSDQPNSTKVSERWRVQLWLVLCSSWGTRCRASVSKPCLPSGRCWPLYKCHWIPYFFDHTLIWFKYLFPLPLLKGSFRIVKMQNVTEIIAGKRSPKGLLEVH